MPISPVTRHNEPTRTIFVSPSHPGVARSPSRPAALAHARGLAPPDRLLRPVYQGHRLTPARRRPPQAVDPDGGYAPPNAPCRFDSHEALVAYLTKLNADWTLATRRLSPRNLIRLLETTGEDAADLFSQPTRSARPPSRSTGRVSPSH